MDAEGLIAVMGILSAVIAIISWKVDQDKKRKKQQGLDPGSTDDEFERRAQDIYREQRRR